MKASSSKNSNDEGAGGPSTFKITLLFIFVIVIFALFLASQGVSDLHNHPRHHNALIGDGLALEKATNNKKSKVLSLQDAIMETPNDVAVASSTAGHTEVGQGKSDDEGRLKKTELGEIAADLLTIGKKRDQSADDKDPRITGPSTTTTTTTSGVVARASSELNTCSAVRDHFFNDLHRQVMSLHQKRDFAGEPDKWAGKHPLCGVHLLHNLTGLVLRARGVSLSTAETHRKSVFTIENCGLDVKPVTKYIPKNAKTLSSSPESGGTSAVLKSDRCPDVYIAARLHGPTVVAANVTQKVEDCSWEVSYELFDPGVYSLEVRVVWLDGLGPEKDHKKRVPITLRKTHSKWGKKPHQKYAFNKECEEQTHIVGSPFTVVASDREKGTTTTTSSSSNEVMMQQADEKPLCGRDNWSLTTKGRWVRHENLHLCGVDRNGSSSVGLSGGEMHNSQKKFNEDLCQGDPSLLNDVKPFNWDYLYAPLGCKFRFFKYGSGPTEEQKCSAKFKRKGTLLLMGDSTTREYSQNFKFFDMRQTGLKVSYANWKIEHQWFGKKMARDSLQSLGRELQGSKPVVLAVNLGPLHLIGGCTTEDWQYYVDQWAEVFGQQDGSSGKNKFDFIERKVFLGPSSIHYATNAMSAQRMLIWIEYAKEKLLPLGFEFVDAWQVTAARPESSWDGVHYAAERGKAQMKHTTVRHFPTYKWNGGVSVMLTQMLINLLCN